MTEKSAECFYSNCNMCMSKGCYCTCHNIHNRTSSVVEPAVHEAFFFKKGRDYRRRSIKERFSR